MLSIKFFLLCIYIAYCSFVILQYKYIVKYFLERSEKMDLFAARFKKLKMERNVTYQIIADAIGIKIRMAQNYASGRQKPTYMRLIALADYFEVSLDYLTGRTNERRDLTSQPAGRFIP